MLGCKTPTRPPISQTSSSQIPGDAQLEPTAVRLRRLHLRGYVPRSLTFAAPVLYAMLGIAALVGIWELVDIIWKPPVYLLPNVAVVTSTMLQHWRLLANGAYVTGYEILIS